MRKLLLVMAACGLMYLPSAAWVQEEARPGQTEAARALFYLKVICMK